MLLLLLLLKCLLLLHLLLLHLLLLKCMLLLHLLLLWLRHGRRRYRRVGLHLLSHGKRRWLGGGDLHRGLQSPHGAHGALSPKASDGGHSSNHTGSSIHSTAALGSAAHPSSNGGHPSAHGALSFIGIGPSSYAADCAVLVNGGHRIVAHARECIIDIFGLSSHVAHALHAAHLWLHSSHLWLLHLLLGLLLHTHSHLGHASLHAHLRHASVHLRLLLDPLVRRRDPSGRRRWRSPRD
mmetsp:Transcript_32296/g.78196  ORF Transcript_32296/g.78196 Transcript_32296/m.78196 type:complete len:238 (+) Transcript_32296:393-1106(+)